MLAGKLDGYHVLAAGLAWHEQVCPVLLFCFGSPRREQAARRALAASRDAAALRIATTALDPRANSPAGPIWLPLPGHTSGQMRLIDLDLALPDPWQDYRKQRARERREAVEREQALHCADEDDELALPGTRPERRSLAIDRDGCDRPGRGTAAGQPASRLQIGTPAVRRTRLMG